MILTLNLISLTFNPEIYYKLAGDDADFTIAGDIKES